MYYLPDGFEAESGYYSSSYSKTYYDGYGYNFYSGEYGYYQASPNYKPESSLDFALVASLLVAVFALIFVVIRYR